MKKNSKNRSDEQQRMNVKKEKPNDRWTCCKV